MFLDFIKTFCQYLTPKKTLTILMGRLAEIKLPWFKNSFIRFFVWLYQVDLSEAQRETVAAYETFNDFFTRHLKAASRPITAASVICPVDGYLAQFGFIQQGQMLQAKGQSYDVGALLAGDRDYTARFKNGVFATFYLSPKDYHRVHMPLEGQLIKTIYVPGSLYSVQPATTRTIPGIFARNERLICLFDTPLGAMAAVMVGATIVGSIVTSWDGKVSRGNQIISKDYRRQEMAQPTIPQGGEMGYFQMGSTVILLFADKQALSWSKNLNIDQAVRFGQALVD